jgi:hypothetical protein
VSPARRRDAIRFLVKRKRVSEHRACQVVGQHRLTQRYERVALEYELRLVAGMNEILKPLKGPRNAFFGYRLRLFPTRPAPRSARLAPCRARTRAAEIGRRGR